MRIKEGKEVVLVISDLQTPFQHPDYLEFLKYLADTYQPTKIVNVGDEIDAHALSRYFKDPDGFGAGHELVAASKALEPLFKEFPDVMVCNSNHTDRPYIRAFEAGIPRSFIKDIGDVLGAPKGWSWEDKWEIDGVKYVHGHCLPSGKTAIQRTVELGSQSTVFGHLHAHAGIYYLANDDELKFSMNVGCLVNHHAYAFTYGKKYMHKPIIGCGIVDRGLPLFIPMRLADNGRWVKSKHKRVSLRQAATLEMPGCRHEKVVRNGSSRGRPKWLCRQCGRHLCYNPGRSK